jgi:NADH-quinone oxidoreductase subunit A
VLVQQYLPILVLIVLSSFLALALVFASRLLGPFRPSRKKLTPYESGMTPIGPAVRRLPVKFYLIAVLFILFDIEVVFFLPWAVVFRPWVDLDKKLGVFLLIEMAVFIVILLVGYVYAWKKGALEWE